MNIIWKIFCLILLSSTMRAQFDDFKIIHSDMKEAMKKFVVGEALALSSKENNTRAFAVKLVDTLDTQYGKEWIAVFGNNSNIVGGSFVKNTTLQFNYKTTSFLIGKRQAQSVDNPNNKNLKLLIEKARNASVHVYATSNNTRLNELVVKAKKVLGQKNAKCEAPLAQAHTYLDWCFYDISTALNSAMNDDEINKPHATVTSVGTIENNFMSSEGSATASDYHLFSLGDLMFDIRTFTELKQIDF